MADCTTPTTTTTTTNNGGAGSSDLVDLLALLKSVTAGFKSGM
ncbi:hypothetical protein [Rhodococcus spelaei]|nr:hypothetical protein [Rhodococcus spelaei]